MGNIPMQSPITLLSNEQFINQQHEEAQPTDRESTQNTRRIIKKLKEMEDAPQAAAGANFLTTTSLVGERYYPRCIVNQPKVPIPRSFIEQQGYVKDGSIGPCRAVQVIRPRGIKKMAFYNWEAKLTKA